MTDLVEGGRPSLGQAAPARRADLREVARLGGGRTSALPQVGEMTAGMVERGVSALPAIAPFERAGPRPHRTLLAALRGEPQRRAHDHGAVETGFHRLSFHLSSHVVFASDFGCRRANWLILEISPPSP